MQINRLMIIQNHIFKQYQKILTIDQIEIRPLFSLTNYVYEIRGHLIEPFLLKIYMPTLEQFADKELETEIISSLVKQFKYPTIFEFSKQYRIEKFISSTEVTPKIISTERLVQIIQKLADYSCNYAEMVQKYNIKKSLPCKYQINHLKQIFKQIYQNKKQQCPQLVHQCQMDLLSVFGNQEVFQNLQQNLQFTKMVLCHNDCHLGNVIMNNETLFLVDYQFSQFNYIGYDIGNFLNQWATQYSNQFQIKPQLELDQETQLKIITIYFNRLQEHYPIARQVSSWIYYTQLGRTLSHLFWMIIGLKQINDPRISFSMIHYIKRRKEEFFKHLQILKTLKI